MTEASAQRNVAIPCHFIIKWHFLLFWGTPVQSTLGLNYWEHSSEGGNLLTKTLLKSSMRLVFSHVQYHVELCLQGMFLPLATGSWGVGAVVVKKNSVSHARCRVRVSRVGAGHWVCRHQLGAWAAWSLRTSDLEPSGEDAPPGTPLGNAGRRLLS